MHSHKKCVEDLTPWRHGRLGRKSGRHASGGAIHSLQLSWLACCWLLVRPAHARLFQVHTSNASKHAANFCMAAASGSPFDRVHVDSLRVSGCAAVAELKSFSMLLRSVAACACNTRCFAPIVASLAAQFVRFAMPMSHCRWMRAGITAAGRCSFLSAFHACAGMLLGVSAAAGIAVLRVARRWLLTWSPHRMQQMLNAMRCHVGRYGCWQDGTVKGTALQFCMLGLPKLPPHDGYSRRRSGQHSCSRRDRSRRTGGLPSTIMDCCLKHHAICMHRHLTPAMYLCNCHSERISSNAGPASSLCFPSFACCAALPIAAVQRVHTAGHPAAAQGDTLGRTGGAAARLNVGYPPAVVSGIQAAGVSERIHAG